MGRRKRSRRARAGLLLLVVALGLAAAYVYTEGVELAPGAAPRPPAEDVGTLRVHYLDVGQGDATLWELPDGSIVVYDCGPPVSEGEPNPVVRYLNATLGRPEGSRLRALVASHGHLDHVGGCEEVLASYAFDTLVEAWYEGADAPQSYQRFLDGLEAKGAPILRLPGLTPGSPVAPNATLLWPPAFSPGGWDAIAEASLVVRLTHGQTSFCFQGDIEDRQEAQLSGRCDVYLMGHHGSRSASSAGWLARMSPSLAVASFGANGYGHPTSDALCRVQQAGATVHTTHRGGDIVIESDGRSLRVLQGEPETADYCNGASYWS